MPAVKSENGSIRLFVAAILVFALGWLILRNAAIRSPDLVPARIAAMIWPTAGSSEANMALARVTASSGRVSGETRSLFEDALNKSPMLSDPIILAGMEAVAAGDTDKARGLMEEARRRDPRSAVARFWLLDNYMRTGDYANGIAEAGPAMRLRPEALTAVLMVLGALIDVPAARPALLAALRADPWWRVGFFQQAANSPGLAPGYAQLLRTAPRPDQDVDAEQEQRAVLLGLVQRGDYGKAYALWRSILPVHVAARVGTVYDPNFTGLPGPSPFAWTYPVEGTNQAVRMPAPDIPETSVIRLLFDGSSRANFAQQLILVPPGGYELSAKARGNMGNDTGGFGLELRCATDGSVLAQLPFDQLGSGFRRYSAQFIAPPSCRAAYLRIVGEPSDFIDSAEAYVTAVTLSSR